MKELTRVHLAKVPYEIEKGAYASLSAYLKEIEAGAEAEILEEVEGRMTEILAERGVKSGGVIVSEDVEALVAQLGSPDAFREERGTPRAPKEEVGKKMLMRDLDHAYLGGVSAGLGAYTGWDPIIFRVAFIAFSFTGAFGFFAYVAMWLLVPPARSDGDRLRMQGQPITVETLAKFREGMREGMEGRVPRPEAFRALGALGRALRIASGLMILLFGVGSLAALAGVGMILWQQPVLGVFPTTGEDFFLMGLAGVTFFSLAWLLLWGGSALVRGSSSVYGRGMAVALSVVAVVSFFAAVSFGGAASIENKARFDEATKEVVIDVGDFTSVTVESPASIEVRHEYDPYKTEVVIEPYLDGKYPEVSTKLNDGVLAVTAKEPANRESIWREAEPARVIVRGPHAVAGE